MKKYFSFISLAALILAASLNSCQRMETDDLQAPDSELSSDGTRGSSFGSAVKLCV